MHNNTPHIGNWSLRTPNGEYVTNAQAIFALMTCNSNSLSDFNLKLAGRTKVEDPHDEDPRKMMTTSSIIGVKSLGSGLFGLTTDRLHEYIVDVLDVDPEWQQIISAVGIEATEEKGIRLKIIEPRKVKEIEVKKASKEPITKAKKAKKAAI